MKKIILLTILLSSFNTFSQKTITPDTNKICFPTEVGKQIMLDLNELDRLKENEKLTEKEIKIGRAHV